MKSKKEKILKKKRQIKISDRIYILSFLLTMIIIITGFTGFLNIHKIGSINSRIFEIAKSHNMKKLAEEVRMNLVLHIGFVNETDMQNTENEIMSFNGKVIRLIDELEVEYKSKVKKSRSNNKKNAEETAVVDNQNENEENIMNTIEIYLEKLDVDWQKRGTQTTALRRIIFREII